MVFNFFRKIFFNNKTQFLTYYLFLPLIIPCIILLLINIVSNKNVDAGTFYLLITDITIVKAILQSISLYTVVNFFTNVGLWSSNIVEEHDAGDKEKYIALSLILGVLSLAIFVFSFMIQNFKLSLYFLVVALIFLVVSLNFYYYNPLIAYGDTFNGKKNGEDVDSDMEKAILK